MLEKIPGTALPFNISAAENCYSLISPLLTVTKGLTLSQVTELTGLETSTIQNWVKRGFLSGPKNKRYSLDQLCRIININMLKSVLPLERICSLLGYVNGQLDDESDDMIDDTKLYFMFVSLASRMKELRDYEAGAKLLDAYLADYEEPVPGARARIEKALRVMLTAWVAARMRHAAEKMLQEL